MKQLVLLIWIMTSLSMLGVCNNVRIEGEVKVTDADVVQSTGIATIKFTVKWDNSWKDAFNHDGFYLFFKYKLDGQGEAWHHAYLMSEGHTVKTPDYSSYMQNSLGIADRCEGLFVYRNNKGSGDAEVALELKWDINSNSDRKIEYNDFVTGRVFISVMGVELVYLPRGAFRAGDTKSNMTFKNNHISIPADKDILTDQKYSYTSSFQTDKKTDNPPEFAANRISDPGTSTTNAWVGATVGTEDWWEVQFDEAKTIRNIAIESIEGHTPTTWELQGTDGAGGGWSTLYTGTGSDWMTGSQRTYPCTYAIKLKNVGAYRRIRIYITNSAQSVAIKNVAMSTENVLDSVDNSVLIFTDTTLMHSRIGLFASDNDTEWEGYTPITYPNGYPAFWAMKYELSQEQYVSFLNKLDAEQQKTRTIGAAFESVKEGDYIFGSHRDRSSSRNGIKLASKGENGEPHLFANDLDGVSDYAQDGDGQTLACNFLNAGDMMAYADWTGLRPLSELEYEKMARRPYPEVAIRGEYAWNTKTILVSTAVRDIGKGSKTEMAKDGHVNAENKIKGPIRCGAYSASGGGQINAGGSFWGLMELSGNLAEIYYNANKEGRVFKANKKIHHGNGKLASSGQADMDNSFWPISEKAFALRGGSFKSEKSELTIADRSRHWNAYTVPSQVSTLRDSTTGFRLGATAPRLSVKGEVTLQNGLTSAEMIPYDTICSGEDYVISGNLPSAIKGAYRIAWFKSENGGGLWDVIPGEEEPILKLSNLRNLNEEAHFFKEYQFKRRIYSSESDADQTRAVSVWVVNHELKMSNDRDTVDVYDHSNGIRVTASQKAEFKWEWIRPMTGNRPLEVEYELIPGISYQNFFKYSDFNDGSQTSGQEENVLVEAKVMGSCIHRDTIKVYIVKEPEKRNNMLADGGGINTDFNCGDILIDNEVPEGVEHLEYTTVKIGDRCWFAENMRRPTEVDTNSKCYGDDPANCEKFGRLYNWNSGVGVIANITGQETKGICPTGWHIPTDVEWNTLNSTVGELTKLSSQLNPWQEGLAGTNESRFSALPTGNYMYNNNAAYFNKKLSGYYYEKTMAIWWTSNSDYNIIGRDDGGWNSDCGWGSGYCTAGHKPHMTYIQDKSWISATNNHVWFTDLNDHSMHYSFANDPAYLLSSYYMAIRCIKNGKEEDEIVQ